MKNTNSYFETKARQWLDSLHIAYSITCEKPTLSGFLELLNRLETTSGDFKNIDLVRFSNLGRADITQLCQEIIEKKQNCPKEFSSILSTIHTSFLLNKQAVYTF